MVLVWFVLFFLMLLILGFDSMFGMLEGVVMFIIDMNFIKNLWKDVVVGKIKLILFLYIKCICLF